MNVTLIQYNPRWMDPAANRAALDPLLQSAAGTDLFVLPELFATGFGPGVRALAEPMDGDTVRWMRSRADACGAAVAGSVAVVEDGNGYNRFCLAEPGGPVHTYDKRHLFAYGGETDDFCAGERRVVVPFRGMRLLLQVCYDLRFPVWSRNRADYDVALYVASWPASRDTVWRTLLQARAIENQCYVVGVNRVGADPRCTYCGGSRVIDAYGQVVAACPDGQTAVVTATLDADALARFRRKFPVLDDADPFRCGAPAASECPPAAGISGGG